MVADRMSRSIITGKVFRFETFWLSHEDFKKVIAQAWSSDSRAEPWSKIAKCIEQLNAWSHHTLGHIRSKIRDTERRLKATQRLPLSDFSTEKCKELMTTLDDLHRQEESYWHIRSRMNELRDGDQNTGYFHHKAYLQMKEHSQGVGR